MRKFVASLAVVSVIAGGALASQIEDSYVGNEVNLNRSYVQQGGNNNEVNMGTTVRNDASVKRSTVENNVNLYRSTIRQGGRSNSLNTGVQAE